ncbi:signal peptidase complex subunit 2, partial [Hyaloraphidium curvatum]
SVGQMLIDEAGFAEDNTHSNRKLLLGYVAIVIALVASSYSFLVPFQESRWIVGSAVATYFLLVLAMWLYGLLVEKDCIFVGVQSNPLVRSKNRVHVSSTFDRRTADYTANFRFSKIPPPASGPREVPRACQKSVGAWFDVDGRFAAGIFRADIEDVLKGNVLHVQ